MEISEKEKLGGICFSFIVRWSKNFGWSVELSKKYTTQMYLDPEEQATQDNITTLKSKVFTYTSILTNYYFD